MKSSKRLKAIFAVVSTTAFLGYGTSTLPAYAQDATWNGPGTDYNTAANWDTNAVPTDNAIFGNQGPSDPTISLPASINRILFTQSAQQYSIASNSNYAINGDGIENNSDFIQTINHTNNLSFNNNATIQAGEGVIINSRGSLSFNDASDPGQAILNIFARDILSDNTANAGFGASLTFNDNAFAEGTAISNFGGDAGGNNAMNVGGSATANFNDNTFLDRSEFTNFSGDASGDGSQNGGGAATAFFNNNSFADRSTLNNIGGGASGLNSVNTGGETLTYFYDNSFIDRSEANTFGGDASGDDSTNTGGSASVVFNDNSFARNTIFNSFGGDAEGTDSDNVGGIASVGFNNNASVDGSEFNNLAGSASGLANSSNIGGETRISFLDDSRVSNSIFNNTAGNGEDNGTGGKASIVFTGNSTVDNLTITNIADNGVDNNNLAGQGGDATIAFYGTSAGNAIITNTGGNSSGGLGVGGRATLTFDLTGNAGSARITNSGPGTFDGPNGASTGGTGETIFNGTSSAGTAVITNNAGGGVFFNGSSTGDTATIVNNAGGVVDTRGTTTANIGSLSGEGEVRLGASTLILGNLNRNDDISGAISDAGLSGSINKIGTGTLILSGANTYTGATIVNGGTLQLDGSITSPLTVVSIGTALTGTGSTSGALINGGFVAPGNPNDPFGTLTVDSFSNSPTGTFVARVNSNDSNQLIADSSTLNGQVFVEGRSLFLGQNQYDYTIIDNTTSNVGTFTGAIDPNSQLPFYIDGALSYPPGVDVHLTLTRNGDLPELSENQRNAGESLDGPGAGSSEFDDIFGALFAANNAKQFQRTLDEVSGDALTSFSIASQGASDRFNNGLLNQAMGQWLSGPSARLALRNVQLRRARMAYTGSNYRGLLAQNMEATARNQAAVEDSYAARNSGLWATIGRGQENIDSDGNGPGFDARATDYQLGYSRNLSDRTSVGIALGLSNGRIDVDNRNADGDIDSTSVGAYIRHEGDKFYAAGSLSYSNHDIDSRRQVAGNTVEADYDARTIAVNGEVGKHFGKGKYSIEPNISLKLANTRQDGFDEDGIGGVNVDGANYNTRRLGLGVRIINRDPNAKIRPHLFAGYEHEFGDDSVELSNQLTGLSAFNVQSSELGKNIFSLRLGADARISERFSLVGQVGASWRKNQDSRYLYGGMKYGF